MTRNLFFQVDLKHTYRLKKYIISIKVLFPNSSIKFGNKFDFNTPEKIYVSYGSFLNPDTRFKSNFQI